MARLYRLMNHASTGLALLGTLGILMMVMHVTMDVVLRAAFSVSIPATLELVTRYYLITLTLLPLAWVEWRRNMITVELFAGVMGERATRWLDALVSVISSAIYVVLAIATWEKAMEQFSIGSYVMSLNFPMPVWPTYFVLPAAFALAAAVCIVRIPLLLSPEPRSDDLGER